MDTDGALTGLRTLAARVPSNLGGAAVDPCRDATARWKTVNRSGEIRGNSVDGCVIDLAAIVRRFGPELRVVARQLAGNETDALDLVQDTFERALRKLPAHLALPSIQSWLHVTLRHRYIDLCRSRDTRVHIALFDEPIRATDEPESEKPRWTGVEPSELWRCVQQLKPPLREVFLLRNRDARSHAEIALELSIPVSTVGTRCHRAMKHLRKMLRSAAAE